MNKLAYGAWMQANEIMREGRRANVTKIYPSSYQKVHTWQLFRARGEDQLMPSWLESRK